MADGSKHKIIRCPVHGDMDMSMDLLTLIDTPEFQRLRGVHQLGTASLVYPGAVHTRFDHSLGTCYLTDKILDGLGVEVDDKKRLAVLAAALLHDLTHIPYGHTLEDERRLFERHDSPQRVQQSLPQGQLGQRLRALKILDQVLEILLSPGRWEFQIFGGAIGSDLLDYLARDAFFCGLTQRYDQRILTLFRYSSQDHLFLEAQRDGVIRQDAISEIIHLLRIRYFLSERVYFHHTKTVSGAMISRAVEAAVEEGLTLEELARETDVGMLCLLDYRFGHISLVRTLLQSLKSRSLFKRVYLLTATLSLERRHEFVERFHKSSQGRSDAERDIAKAAGVNPCDLIVYCPALKMQLKEAQVKVKIDNGPCRSLDELQVGEIEVLQERHRQLWRFYVFVHPDKLNRAKKIGAACENYFQEANHLPRFETGQLYLGL